MPFLFVDSPYCARLSKALAMLCKHFELGSLSLYKLARIEMRKKFEAEMEFKRTHPEEYERQRKIKLEEAKARGKKCAEDMKELLADMSLEDCL